MKPEPIEQGWQVVGDATPNKIWIERLPVTNQRLDRPVRRSENDRFTDGKNISGQRVHRL